MREQAGKLFVGSLHVWIRLDARCPQVFGLGLGWQGVHDNDITVGNLAYIFALSMLFVFSPVGPGGAGLAECGTRIAQIQEGGMVIARLTHLMNVPDARGQQRSMSESCELFDAMHSIIARVKLEIVKYAPKRAPVPGSVFVPGVDFVDKEVEEGDVGRVEDVGGDKESSFGTETGR